MQYAEGIGTGQKSNGNLICKGFQIVTTKDLMNSIFQDDLPPQPHTNEQYELLNSVL